MLAWERALTRALATVRLNGITSKILLFAVFATLLPAVGTGWLSYRNNSQTLTENVAQQLDGLASHAAQNLDLWLRERRYEVRVISSSYEVSENLSILRRDSGGPTGKRARGRLENYLESVWKRFPDYGGIAMLDPNGAVIASSGAVPTVSDLGEGWVESVRGTEPVVESPRRPASATPIVRVTQAVATPEGEPLGFLAVEVELRGLYRLLHGIAPDPTRFELLLVDHENRVLASSAAPVERLVGARLSAAASRALGGSEGLAYYTGSRAAPVAGIARDVDGPGWHLVAEADAEHAFAPIRRLRNTTFALVVAMLLGVGLAAYLLGLTLVRPLHRLTRGAEAVAAGDLDVDVPEVGGGEIASLTRTFNQMVSGLRAAREDLAAANAELREKNRKLHELSITDGLTGLFNRSYLTRILTNEADRCRRHMRPFAVLMIDIDGFKRFNDTHGHLAGDTVLRGVAETLKDGVRACDYVARFGGEEFLVLLPETGLDAAADAGERLRDAVERAFASDDRGPITISVGVAGFREHGLEVDAIVQAADAAMYSAKRGGRNRVVVAPSGAVVAERSDRAAG